MDDKAKHDFRDKLRRLSDKYWKGIIPSDEFMFEAVRLAETYGLNLTQQSYALISQSTTSNNVCRDLAESLIKESAKEE